MALDSLDRAVHMIALKLGKTAEDVRENMTWDELQDWLEFFQPRKHEAVYMTDAELFGG